MKKISFISASVKKILFLIFLVLLIKGTKAQMVIVRDDTTHIRDSMISGIYIPKNIEECFNELSKPNYQKLNSLLSTIPENDINKEFNGTGDFWLNWHFQDASRLTKYFNDLGICHPKNMQNIILYTYYRKLHNEPIKFEEELIKFKNIEAREEQEYQKRFKQDSINGVYIPKNMEDCFLQLNKLLSKKDITQIKNLKNKNETGKYHLSLGMWIRNNWGLWGGSRLQKYIMDRIQTEPDGMSSLVLEFYWEWLNGINKNWKEFDQKNKR